MEAAARQIAHPFLTVFSGWLQTKRRPNQEQCKPSEQLVACAKFQQNAASQRCKRSACCLREFCLIVDWLLTFAKGSCSCSPSGAIFPFLFHPGGAGGSARAARSTVVVCFFCLCLKMASKSLLVLCGHLSWILGLLEVSIARLPQAS